MMIAGAQIEEEHGADIFAIVNQYYEEEYGEVVMAHPHLFCGFPPEMWNGGENPVTGEREAGYDYRDHLAFDEEF